MIPGIMAGQARPVSAGAVLWTPLNMAVVPQIYLDAQDSVVTDVSGACSAISNLGSMGSDGDFSQATSANRPTILAAAVNGKRALSFDGTDDVLTAASTAAKSVFKNVSAAYTFVVYKKRTLDATPKARYMLYSGDVYGAARFSPLCGLDGAGRGNKPAVFAKRLDADNAATLGAPSVSQGAYAIVMHSVDFSSRAGLIRVDGTQVVSNATLTASSGNTSDTVSGVSISVGAYPTGILASDVDLAAIVIGNAQHSVAEFEKLEGWAAHKYGLTANLPGGHPYKTVAPTV